MKLVKLSIVCVALAASVTPAVSGKIERARLKSERPASRSTCSCIQNVAAGKLSSGDQALTATFLADSQRARHTRSSDNRSAEAL